MAWPFTEKMPERVASYYDFTNSAVSGTVTASTTPCVLGKLIVNGGTMGALVIRDATAASGTRVIATITAPVSGNAFDFNIRCNTGLSVFASAATNYTLTYLR